MSLQGQRRGPARPAAEPKAPAGRRDPDINRERLVYCLTSLVGQRAIAKLRNDVTYEGVFHSCALDSDFSITLTCARQLPTGNGRGGEVVRTLVIPGKDFLQVSAADVPLAGGLPAEGGTSFATDGEIAEKQAGAGKERELVAWAPTDADGPAPDDGKAGLEDGAIDNASVSEWAAGRAREMAAVSTYKDELYTTKLDPKSIPLEKRTEAERIAREIEGGRQFSERDEAGDVGEEERCSAVTSGGTRGKLKPLPEVPGNRSSGKQLPQVPLTEESLTAHDNLSTDPSDFAREHRAKRGIITAYSPMRSPMISEMKRINALNLEPALPKLDDKTRNDWINFKQSQSRTAKSTQNNVLKQDFQQSLEVIQKRQETKAMGAGEGGKTPGGNGGAGDATPSGNAAGSETGRSKFSFNPAAKEYSFNPAAASFTPTNSAALQAAKGQMPQPQQQMQQSQQQMQPAMPFNAQSKSVPRRSLNHILDKLFHHAKEEKTQVASPQWPGATSASYHEILGQPDPASPITQMSAAMVGGATAPAANWQMGQGAGQMATGPGPMASGPGAPQMMQGPGPGMAFVVAAPVPGQQQGQMYPGGQMYAAQNAGGMPAQRLQGAQGGMPPQQQQQQPQQQQQQQPQQQQQQVIFNQQPMMQQQQAMAMQGCMGMQGGPNQTGGPAMGQPQMQKYGGQPQMQMQGLPQGVQFVPVMAGGQGYPNGGFMPQQAMQAQMSQQGQPGGPQGGQMMGGPQGPMGGPQGQMMQAAYHHQMGGPGPHQMTGHDVG